MKRLISAVRLIILLLLRPDRFVQDATKDVINRELARNEQLRAQYPDGVLPSEKQEQFANNERMRTTRLRRALAGGFGSVVVAVALAWLSGLLAHHLLGPAPPWLSWGLQIGAAAILLGATLSVLGWEIQSWKGDTLPERVNRWIFRTLYMLGTYLLLLSMFWSADGSELATVNTGGFRWFQWLTDKERIGDLLVNLVGTFAGVLLAFLLSGWWDHRQAKKRYADTLNAVRHDLANLGSLCRQLSDRLRAGGGWDTMSPLEAPVMDAVRINPAFNDQAPHGLVMCLTVLVTLCGTVRAELDHAKLATSPDFTGLVRRVNKLIRVIDYAQDVLDREVEPLGQPIVKTSGDVQIIEGLQRALRGENAQRRSGPS